MVDGAVNPETKRELLIRLSQFKSNDKGEGIKLELDNFYVKQALFFDDIDKKGLSLNEIYASINLHCPIAKLNKDQIESIVQSLVKNKHIENLGNNRYFLSRNERDVIEASTNAFKANRTNFLNQLMARVKQVNNIQIDRIKEDELLILFESFFAELLFKYGHSVAKNFIALSKNPKTVTLIEFQDLNAIALRAISTNANPEIQKIPVSVILDIFKEPEKYLSYVESLSRLFIYIEVQNADPDIIKFEISQLEDHTLFLDTNILIPLLCKHNSHHKMATRLIDLSTLFKFNLYYSVNTKKELLNYLDTSNTSFKLLVKKYKRIEKLLEHTDNVFIHDFSKRHAGISSRLNKWDGYYHTIKSELNNLDKTIKINLVRVEEDLLKHDNFEKIRSHILKAHSLKRKSVQIHDAYHILLIKKKRMNDDLSILGSKFWFVTDDSTLKKAESTYEDACKYPSTIQIEHLLTTLDEYTYISGNQHKSSVDLFLELIQSSIEASIPRIRTQDLIDVADDWLNFEELTDERIIDTLADKQFQKRLDVARKRKDETPKEIALSKFIGDLKKDKDEIEIKLQKTETDKHVKESKFDAENQLLQQKIGALENRIKELEKMQQSEKKLILDPKAIAKPSVPATPTSSSLDTEGRTYKLFGAIFGINILLHTVIVLIAIAFCDVLIWSTTDKLYFIGLLTTTFIAASAGIAWLHNKNLI